MQPDQPDSDDLVVYIIIEKISPHQEPDKKISIDINKKSEL